MFQVECIENDTGFLALREQWDELWESAISPSIFLSHSWVQCCWPELRVQNEMRILLVRDSDKLVAIAPLMKSRVFSKGLPVERLSFIEHPETQIANIVLRNSDASTDALKVLLRYLLRESSSDWQLLSLDKIPPHSKSLRILTRFAQISGLHYEVKSSHGVPFISLRGGWEAYLKSRTPRFRKTLRNVANRINRLGSVEVKRYLGGEGGKEALEKLFLVSSSSWKVSNGIAITSSKGRKRFFHDLTQVTHTDGVLQVWILEANGIPIASETQIRDGTKIYALRSDYDERYADSSPGTYLQAEILKNLFHEPYEEYNLGVGRNPYKMRWANREISLMNFRLYNRTLYGRLLHSIDRFAFSRLKQIPPLRMMQGFLLGRLR